MASINNKKKKKDKFPKPIWSMQFQRDSNHSIFNFQNEICLGFSVFRQKKGEPEKLGISMLRFVGKNKDVMYSSIDLSCEEVISLIDALSLLRNRFTKQ